MQSPTGGGPSSGAQGWGWPYWNQLWIDAVIAALHDAPRDGVALLAAPATGPTVELSAETGYLPAGQTLQVAQTWVDEWGRETDAGVVTEFSTGEGIPNPDTAPTLGTPAPVATGFDGGLLEVAYCWIDEMAGESLPSPVAQADVPYRTAGLQSEVLVTLPATPVSVGAAGAFIYARHRSGNWVRAAAISDDTETEITLDGTWISCFVSLPLANSTGAGKALDITGVVAPAAAALTRFYIRAQGEAWTAGDRRLRVGGVDEWDPATITYPLVFRGGADEVAPGYPPPLTQILPIRKIDLGTEVDGVADATHLPEEVVLEEELVRSIGDALISGCEVAAHSPADMGVHVDAGEVLLATGRFTPVACDRAIPAADATHPRIDLVCIASDGAVEGPTENASLKGTPASTPAAPAVPAGYVILAEVLVGEEATSIAADKITDRRLLTTLAAEAVARLTHEADAIHTGASAAETNTGTDATKKVTPNGLAGSYAGTKSMSIVAVELATEVEVGASKIAFVVPPALSGMNLVYANAYVNVAGTTNATTVEIYNVSDGVSMLTEEISIASEDTAGAPGTVDTAHDDVEGGDVLRIDVPSVSSTAPLGLMVVLEFRLP